VDKFLVITAGILRALGAKVGLVYRRFENLLELRSRNFVMVKDVLVKFINSF